MIKILKVALEDINKKSHKKVKKRAKDCLLQENLFTYASEKMNIFTQTKTNLKRKLIRNFKSYDNRVAVTKLRLF